MKGVSLFHCCHVSLPKGLSGSYHQTGPFTILFDSLTTKMTQTTTQGAPVVYVIDVTIKINRPNVQSILATFERFNYLIKASFNESDYLDSLQERYDSLMAYLNV